jgi:hypothetical protein
MRALLAALRHGRGLRHVPVGARETDVSPVRVLLRGSAGEERDVTREHALVSLRPLIVGVRVDAAAADPTSSFSLAMVDRESATVLGTVTLSPAGSLPLSGGTLALFRTAGCRDATAPAHVRWWRYALASVHARRSAARGDDLGMSAADLRCLNVCYMVPRPVHLVGVSGAAELFTSSLVARLGDGGLLVSLPANSAEIAAIEASRVVAISAAPADRLRDVLALGAYQRRTAAGAGSAFALRPSARHSLPVLADGFSRELTVLAVHRVGSHVLFDCCVDGEHGTPPRQVAYLSQMYVEWLVRHGRTVDPL